MARQRTYYVYIMASKGRVLYVGNWISNGAGAAPSGG